MSKGKPVLEQFDELVAELRDVAELLDASVVAEALLDTFNDTNDDSVVDYARLAFLGSIVIEYAMTCASNVLAEADASDAAHAKLNDAFDALSDQAHVAAQMIRVRQTQERVRQMQLVAVPEGQRVFLVDDEGATIDGFELTHVNAPGPVGLN